MTPFKNPHRGGPALVDAPFPRTDAASPAALLSRCPAHQGPTPLVNAPGLAKLAGVGEIWIKDERARIVLGSFKALGAAYVIAHQAANLAHAPDETTLKGTTFVTASAGNHGLSVAAGARAFGAKAVVYLSSSVPQDFARRLSDIGANVVRAGDTYDESMQAAKGAGVANGWTLLSDTSWPGYFELPHRLMEGYLVMATEAADQLESPPTHVMVQAGVGGLACAVAAYIRTRFGDAPKIIVVEPVAAPAIIESLRAGACVIADGPVSNMGRLDCKEPSLIALNGLARDADLAVTISDAQAEAAMPVLATAGFETSPPGGAGLVAVLNHASLADLGMGPHARILAFLSEGPS